MDKASIQSATDKEIKSQTVPIQLQLEPTVRTTLKRVSKDQDMTYTELITSMLENQYPEVLTKAHQVEETGWEL
ncbi:hypothetical protein [Paraeggerthella sp. Marseille-Q4926]|uniref:hypothetical protein n=1 Tax=Paraeggerthella sp. Marseille-Q4926 TaxID=2866587 RepID=UPI001CE46FB6|nr:hypothetical protein [Paraeggerthella sp. Marseille-Q4926]